MKVTSFSCGIDRILSEKFTLPALPAACIQIRNIIINPCSLFSARVAKKEVVSLDTFEDVCNGDVNNKIFKDMDIDGEGKTTYVKLSGLRASNVRLSNIIFSGADQPKIGSAMFTDTTLETVHFIGGEGRHRYTFSAVEFNHCIINNLIIKNADFESHVIINNTEINALELHGFVDFTGVKINNQKSRMIAFSFIHLENIDEFSRAFIDPLKTDGYFFKTLASLSIDGQSQQQLRVDMVRELFRYMKTSETMLSRISASEDIRRKLYLEVAKDWYKDDREICAFKKEYLKFDLETPSG